MHRPLTFLLVAAFLAVAAPVAPARASAALPLDRLHFGVSSGPSDLGWMTATGGWTYRYQYLAGGVNTPGNWQTWQDPSKPPGQFVLDYSDASRSAGIVPVFTYYELLQSTPSSGGNESERDWNNLHNAATMHAYYADFALLMRRLGQYGGPAIVHVEPDLWGYLQQRAAAAPASTLSATVGSSGVAEVAGIPDTVAGYADALLHLRDLYAPNIDMALHASMWGSGVDVATDTRSSVDGGAVGRATGAFLSSAGIASNPYGSTWDLVFHDVDDHDAAWWQAQGADNGGFTHWWDATNSRLPNFARWLQWVAGLRSATGVPQVAWQVPIGNQHYLTMNNTCGHYQDNVAEYILGHPDQVAGAGISAVMFGAGNACQTTNLDAQKDGVTNNGGQPTTDLAGGCNACNTATSTVPDDDGGYLRNAVPAYERAGAVPVAGLAPSVPPLPNEGYWLVASDGGIFPFGVAGGYGSTGAVRLNQPIVGMAPSPPDGHGYWLVARDGGIFPFGNAGGYGSTGNIRLNQPIVGMAPTPDGHGYWLVASDGGIFPFGDAGGYGSTGNIRLNQPIVGMAPTPSGRGYWLVASDGGIFPFGDAAGLGSTGGIRLNQPIVAMASTPDGLGYWLVASDGGIFPFGDAAGLGSTGGMRLNRPVVGMASTRDGRGYWLVASDGGIFPFGDAGGLGSTGAVRLNQPIVGMASSG
jgi:hypothetical protein